MLKRLSSLNCIRCGLETVVLQTRVLSDTNEVRRYRACKKGHRFTTLESFERSWKRGRPRGV